MNKLLIVLILSMAALLSCHQWREMESLSLQVEQYRDKVKAMELEHARSEAIVVALHKFIKENAEEINRLKKRRFLTVTAYSPRASETDSSPLITASNSRVREGICAVSRDLYEKGWVFGRKVYVEDMGVFVIEDLMGKRKKEHLDIFMNSTRDAVDFGKKKLEVYLLDENA